MYKASVLNSQIQNVGCVVLILDVENVENVENVKKPQSMQIFVQACSVSSIN